MPGGQYTNLKEQAASMGVAHRWPEIARTYAEVNQLFGDIVKVTPSSARSSATWRCSSSRRGIKPADVVNLEPGAHAVSRRASSTCSAAASAGRWAAGRSRCQRVVLGEKTFKEAAGEVQGRSSREGRARRGAEGSPPQLDLDEAAAQRTLAEKLKREPTDDDLYSHLMYPQVFADFAKHQRDFSDVSVLPTPAFFYGLRRGEEISVDIEEGKMLIIRLINVSEPDKDGRRTVTYELNGITREAFIADKSVAPKTKARPKADLADPPQIAAPIPGLVAVLIDRRLQLRERQALDLGIQREREILAFWAARMLSTSSTICPSRSLITRRLPALPARCSWNASSTPSWPTSSAPVKPSTCAITSPPG